ncbi:hypothetical protein [Oenococcus kitaharae]|uniref:Uncharacterized protein n=1 Tax=Oenococcus kitaharae DSM 17330 TaxID=1045004 RepID=G9WJI4_9LACO|nr:hypothetical protein [Oenococcus kitaharae]EHN59029.1 hypothetical protein OKIT_0925 [Oenococcus kitaharae DSM 17330]OEY83744.1 hypothetical protein NT96_05600 [Oenococcus kitaharae]OEY83916.1 hypothetical protein NT95_03440 [Oenococcus kitaharae]OEY84192.1 hypothetical protein NV75_04900 [Oenococcus kitaharae]
MKNEDTKKPVSERTDQSSNANGLNTWDIKDDIYTHSNLNQHGSEQERLFNDTEFDLVDLKNINTHIFDGWLDMSESLKRLANSLTLGRFYARPSTLIADQLNISVRRLFDEIHDLRVKYHIPVVSFTYGEYRGLFIAQSSLEVEAYTQQARSRENESIEAREAVENGVKEGILNKIKRLFHEAKQHD